jgi:hypothetical protein
MLTRKIGTPVITAPFITSSFISIPLAAQIRSPVAPRDKQFKAVNEAYALF